MPCYIGGRRGKITVPVRFLTFPSLSRFGSPGRSLARVGMGISVAPTPPRVGQFGVSGTHRRRLFIARAALCLDPWAGETEYGMASYDGPAIVTWKHKGTTVKSAMVRCVMESYSSMTWQGKLVKFPSRLCRLWGNRRRVDAAPTRRRDGRNPADTNQFGFAAALDPRFRRPWVRILLGNSLFVPRRQSKGPSVLAFPVLLADMRTCPRYVHMTPSRQEGSPVQFTYRPAFP
jgi:hypothetical protein